MAAGPPSGSWNDLLHASHQADIPVEGQKLLGVIMQGLADARITCNLKPLRYLLNQLKDFLDLKHKLADADRVWLVQVLDSLAVLPDIDTILQGKICIAMERLLKKDYLHLDLVINWRPYYDILSRSYYGKARSFKYVNQKKHGIHIVNFLRVARKYFPPEATQEILDTLRPFLCPFDTKAFEAFGFLVLLLPTVHDGHPVWLDEVMAMWDWIPNCKSWDHLQTSLLARLSRDQCGAVDFGEYLPLVYGRFLRMCEVPVGTAKVPRPQRDVPFPLENNIFFGRSDMNHGLHAMARLIVYTLKTKDSHGETGADHVRRLFNVLSPFFHPSNTGRWTQRLGVLVCLVAEEYCSRIAEEKMAWCRTPADARLTEADTDNIMDILLPPVMQCLFSKNMGVKYLSTGVTGSLAWLCPKKTFETLLEMIYPALTAVTESHRTIAALDVLASVAVPMFTYENFPEGATHLMPLLQLVLPGIDPNDPMKTFGTLRFLTATFLCVPLVDSSQEPPPKDITDMEREVRASTALLEDWLALLLDRIFALFDQMAGPEGSSAKAVGWVETGISKVIVAMASAMFNQMSDALFARALTRIVDFAASPVHTTARKAVGNFLEAAASAKPALALKTFFPLCTRVIREEAKALPDVASSSLVWNLRILNQMVKCGGEHLLTYRREILEIMDLIMPSTDKAVGKEGGKLWRNASRALTSFYPLDWRSQPPAVWNSPEFAAAPWRWWGATPAKGEEDVRWHEPTDEEVKFAFEIVGKASAFAFAALEGPAKCDDGGAALRSTTNEEMMRDLMVLRNSLRAAVCMMPGFQPEESRKDVVVSTRSRAVDTYLEENAEARGFMERTGSLLHALTTALLKHREDDTKALKLVCKSVYRIFNTRGGFDHSKGNHYQSGYVALKARARNPTTADPKRHVRFIQVCRAITQHLTRMGAASRAVEDDALHRQLLDDLLLMSCSTYSKVRSKAQATLKSCVDRYGPWARDVVLKCTAILANAAPVSEGAEGGAVGEGSTSDEITGALYILSTRSFLNRALRSLDLFSALIHAVCSPRLMAHDKLSVQARVKALYDLVHRNFYTHPLRAPPAGHLPAALKGWRASEGAVRPGGNNEATYHRLVNDLLGLFNGNPNMHWRYQANIGHCLLMLLREDTVPSAGHAAFMLDALVSEVEEIRRVARFGVGRVATAAKPKQPRRPPTTAMTRITPEDFASFPVPRSKEEWNRTDWFDPLYLGWNGLPAACQVYAEPVEDMPASLPADRAAVRDVFLSRMTSEAFVARFVSWLENLPRKGQAAFSVTTASMHKGVFQLLQDIPLDVFRPHLVRLAKDYDTRESQVTAAEILAGMCRGSKHWPYEKAQRLWDLAREVLVAVLAEANPDSSDDWKEALVYIVSDWDPRRFGWLASFLFDNPLTRSQSSLGQAKALQAIFPVLNHFSWRAGVYQIPLLEELRGAISQPYKQVRYEMGHVIACALLNSFSYRRDATSGFASAKSALPALPAHAATFMKALLDELETSALEDPATLSEEALKDLTIARKSGLNILYFVCNKDAQIFLPFLDRLLPLLFGMIDDADVAVPNSAKTILMGIASMTGPSFFSICLDALKKVSECSSWRQREFILHFLQVLLFGHVFSVRGDAVNEAVELVISMMCSDTQVEVRDLASTSLAGLVMCLGNDRIPALTERFVKLASKKLRKRKAAAGLTEEEVEARAAKDAKALLTRHAGVLGLAALSRVDPYSVPEWMPPVVLALSSHFDDPMPIKTTVRSAFADFWRTHRDTWSANMHRFTPEELEALKATTTTTYNYFA